MPSSIPRSKSQVFNRAGRPSSPASDCGLTRAITGKGERGERDESKSCSPVPSFKRASGRIFSTGGNDVSARSYHQMPFLRKTSTKRIFLPGSGDRDPSTQTTRRTRRTMSRAMTNRSRSHSRSRSRSRSKSRALKGKTKRKTNHHHHDKMSPRVSKIERGLAERVEWLQSVAADLKYSGPSLDGCQKLSMWYRNEISGDVDEEEVYMLPLKGRKIMIPCRYVCPIGKKIMSEPVREITSSDSYPYAFDKESAMKLLKNPGVQKEFRERVLYLDLTLKTEIQFFIRRNEVLSHMRYVIHSYGFRKYLYDILIEGIKSQNLLAVNCALHYGVYRPPKFEAAHPLANFDTSHMQRIQRRGSKIQCNESKKSLTPQAKKSREKFLNRSRTPKGSNSGGHYSLPSETLTPSDAFDIDDFGLEREDERQAPFLLFRRRQRLREAKEAAAEAKRETARMAAAAALAFKGLKADGTSPGSHDLNKTNKKLHTSLRPSRLRVGLVEVARIPKCTQMSRKSGPSPFVRLWTSEKRDWRAKRGSPTVTWGVKKHKTRAIWGGEVRLVVLERSTTQRHIHIELLDAATAPGDRPVTIARGRIALAVALNLGQSKESPVIVALNACADWSREIPTDIVQGAGSGGSVSIFVSSSVTNKELEIQRKQKSALKEIPIEIIGMDRLPPRLPDPGRRGVSVRLCAWLSVDHGIDMNPPTDLRSCESAIAAAGSTTVVWKGESTYDSKWKFVGDRIMRIREGMSGEPCVVQFALFVDTVRHGEFRTIERSLALLGGISVSVISNVPSGIILKPPRKQGENVDHDDWARVVFKIRRDILSVSLLRLNGIYNPAHSYYAEAFLWSPSRSEHASRSSQWPFGTKRSEEKQIDWTHCRCRLLIYDPELKPTRIFVRILRSKPEGKDEIIAEAKIALEDLNLYPMSFEATRPKRRNTRLVSRIRTMFLKKKGLKSPRDQKEMGISIKLNSTPVHVQSPEDDNKMTELSESATCLHHAASIGDPSILTGLLRQAKDFVNSPDQNGTVPLHIAVFNRNLEAVTHLIKASASSDMKDNTGRTPLHYCSTRGSSDMAKVLIEAMAQTDITDGDGWTPMHFAAFSGRFDIVEILARNGADTEVEEKKGGARAIHLAVSEKQHKTVQALIRWRSGLNKRDKTGATPLHHAAYHNSLEMSESLLKGKANVNAQDGRTDLWTSLHYAVNNHNHSLVTLLLDYKADLSIRDRRMAPPLHYACRDSDEKMALLLLERKASVSSKDVKERTPLHRAAERGASGVIRQLIKYKAVVDAKDPDWWTPLSGAASLGFDEAVRALLEAQADVTIRNKYGMNALHCASYWNRVGTARALLEFAPLGYVESRIRNSSGSTPLFEIVDFKQRKYQLTAKERPLHDGLSALEVAASGGAMEVFRVLVDFGATCTFREVEKE
ncbi:hypothetical protein AAMO2058_000012800 [Amorphochlora amoebiformis]